MTNRPARITQAEVARVIRAAKQAGASEILIQLGDVPMTIKLSTVIERPIETEGEVIL